MGQMKINFIIWSVIFAVIAYVFDANDHLNIVAGYALVFLSGLFGGAAIVEALSIKQWPIMKRHLNKKTMEQRLREINHTSGSCGTSARCASASHLKR